MDSLKDNRLRTFLSIAGITIGVTAVIVIGTAGQSGHHLVFSELETFGLKSVWIRRDYDDKDPRVAVRTGKGITNEDLKAIQGGCCSAVDLVTPIVQTPRHRHRVQAGNAYASAQVEGVGAHYTAINNDSLDAGRGLREADERKKRQVAVIGPSVKTELFADTSDALGRHLRIDGKKFTIVGVLKEKDRGFLSSIGSAGGKDANARVLVPYATYQKLFSDKGIDMLQLKATAIDVAETAAQQVTALLQRRHGAKYSYKSDTMAQYIGNAERILRGVSTIGIIGASVSLIVGGMGILNIMTTSVLERTREIGVRKALGARGVDIMMQFLLEAVFISLIGGSFGLLAGFVASMSIVHLTDFPFSISWGSIAVAVVVSIAVGLLSGFFPARRASRMQPVVALRYE